MLKLWPWRRAAQSVPQQSCHRSGAGAAADPVTMPYGPWSVVYVCDKAVARDDAPCDDLVAVRRFADPAQAERVGSAWQRHRPAADVRVRHEYRSSWEPNYAGSYRDADGSWRTGQPAEIDALVAEIVAEEEERAAEEQKRAAEHAEQRRREQAELEAKLAEWDAKLEAERPRQVVVAEAGEDTPIPHHDLFVKATQVHVLDRPWGKVEFHFRAFTGREPKPVAPDGCYDRSVGSKQRRRLIEAEYDAAAKLWTAAVYRRKAETALRAAAEKWPEVAAAFDRIERAWSDLDNPPHGWEVAVKQLLDAHDAGRSVVSDWEYAYVRNLAAVDAEMGLYESEADGLRGQLGTELGIDGAKKWLVGYGPDLENGAREHLNTVISTQLARLAEITRAASGATR